MWKRGMSAILQHPAEGPFNHGPVDGEFMVQKKSKMAKPAIKDKSMDTLRKNCQKRQKV